MSPYGTCKNRRPTRHSLALGLVASPWVATTLKGRLRRDCLATWWRMPRGVEIPAEQQRGIVDFLMAWIEREMGY